MIVLRSRRLPACAGLRETVDIALPELVLARAEIVEVIPRVNAGLVAVGECWTKRVVAYGLDVCNRDIALAGLQCLLSGPVAAHFGGRRIDTKEFIRKAEASTIGERELEDAR